MSIDTVWTQSQEIRNNFRAVEIQEWGAEQYAAELIVQIGHLADILLRQKYKLNFKNKEENHKIIGDELCDIILGAFSIADHYGIDLIPFIKKYISSPENEEMSWKTARVLVQGRIQGQPDLSLLFKIFCLTNEVINNIQNINTTELSKYSLVPKLAEIFFYTYMLAIKHDVDIGSAFTQMQKESNLFVNKNKPK